MGSRFDEVDLLTVVPPEEVVPATEVAPAIARGAASRLRRILSLAVDLSLFFALALAMSPLLPAKLDATRWTPGDLLTVFGLAGFLLLLSYYYFTVCWLVWGKTIGGAISDVRVVADGKEALDARGATIRWFGTLLSVLTAGLGFLPALLPGGRSFADRASRSHSVRG